MPAILVSTPGTPMKLDPVSLRLFVSVIEEGTIAAAAKREHIAAAAVSKRLSELEELLDAQLLNRTNKGITATDAGLSLLFMARSALNNLNEIVVQMPSLPAIQVVQDRLDKPVLSASVATVYQILKTLGLEAKVPNAGHLLSGQY